MPRQDLPIDNAGIREVRRWRGKLQRRAGGTLEGLWKLLTQATSETERPQARSAKPKRPKSNPTRRRK